ncbi:MAG: histidine kinase dimerization/phospho-acceptor domain-containing protein [Syntrophobacteraceae bacterium]|nr:histidine kinase dimerization/phospho-acceptor domain-containing protein [Syntrophobacteraceae bacterium]
MTEDKSGEDRTAKVRRLAEERSGESARQTDRIVAEQDSQRVVHELQVHQIELEMQNEELRMAQRQLGESLAKYSDLYDFAPVGYITSNRDGLILETNLTFAGQLGVERGRLVETPLWLYVAAPDRAKLKSHFDQVFKSNERRTCELRLQRPSGPELYVQLDSAWVLDVDGAELCRTSVTDISIRKEVEKEVDKVHDELERRVDERTAQLSENEGMFRKLSQEFQTLLNAISDTLILLSPEMEILWTNRGNALELNETTSDPIGQYCYKLLHDRSAPSEDSPVTSCFDTVEKKAAVVTHQGAVLDIRAFPIKEAERVSSVLLVVSDITEKMAMQAEAMQAAHMASLGELAAGVAHEINNPITGIINYGQILINECSPESMEKDIGERIVKEGERIGLIVKTLLSFARGGQEVKKPIGVPAVLEESIILIQAQIRKEGIDLKIGLPEDLPEVEANFQQLQQGFINIINNARYALNEKYPGRHKDKRLEITGEKVIIGVRPHVRIVFYDRGVGISTHELSMLTKPFFSTKPFGKGTGLGLNITQKIITDHGGQLSFESAKGEFTSVIIDLPAIWSGDGVEK